ncbi:unnamed protein product [Penicillium salamii]|uniref:tRNA (guanine(10)-N(2))-methyltransferase n=1 Tax=Penicillium salamii TaxID=1612424 RepID=A0A9W4IUM0_9EURO|nr:unnamed protein product [Penicillium salamii]CAG8237936.1 unnamed protein product [Penicillium salamii]CAG8359733.1 unnamed protein product [Penicillium salamii]CAG8365891.1 unnamed protein product [Penicillium salamii]CAG8366998.1 unnamed protein product [Penicillium salamii]
MDYLVRFAQTHETFRRPELEACATIAGANIEILSYNQFSPHCIVRFPDAAAAAATVKRSILAKDVFELWGQGTTYEELHEDIRQRSQHLWEEYSNVSWKFVFSCFSGTRSAEKKGELMRSFQYMGFRGPIRMKNPEQEFHVMEEYIDDIEVATLKVSRIEEPRKIYLGRKLATSCREDFIKYDLKKRRYISTTSMDAELSLVTANMALAAPGKLFFDPFVGTGSFIVCAAHFGALTMGADIDGRSFRGKDRSKLGVYENFIQYKTESKFIDTLTSDLTNTPFRRTGFLDGIVCDPPYGVREGLRVLGERKGKTPVNVIIDGVPAHLRPGFIPPKKPYGFEALQNDVLNFAVRSLVTNGRLSMWMPTSNDEKIQFPVPMHEDLEVVSVCVQDFGNWARRLITYRRLPEGEKSDVSMARKKTDDAGYDANELNAFRRVVRSIEPQRSNRLTEKKAYVERSRHKKRRRL